MTTDNRFYVYMYLREKDSETAKAGTPYYIGKGNGRRAYARYGNSVPAPANLDMIVMPYENLLESDAFLKEKELISFYGRKDNGSGILINLTDGGEGASGHKHSSETREKMSKWQLGRVIPATTKTTLSKLLKGKPVSRETHEKMKLAKSKPFSEETRQRMSESRKGKKLSKDHALNISRGLKGYIKTPEHRDNISKNHHMSKKVVLDGVEYRSLSFAAKAFNMNPNTFLNHVKSGKIKVERIDESRPVIVSKHVHTEKVKVWVMDGVRYYTIKSACESLGITRSTFCRRMHAKKIKVEYI